MQKKKYEPEFRLKMVKEFRKCTLKGEKISDFAKRKDINYVTFFGWLKKYGPDLLPSANNDNNTLEKLTSPADQSLQDLNVEVISEHYKHDIEITDTQLSDLQDKIARLEKENRYLAKSVCYWTHQYMSLVGDSFE